MMLLERRFNSGILERILKGIFGIENLIFDTCNFLT